MIAVALQAPVTAADDVLTATADHLTGQPTLCAWCMREQGVAPKEGDSHGICKMHSQRMVAEYHQIRARRSKPCA